MILLTGFNPFGGLPTNITESLVTAVGALWSSTRQGHLKVAVLPTEYHRAGEAIVGLIRDHSPTAVMCCGLAETESTVRFERLARNWDCSGGLDNVGTCRAGDAVVPGGPQTYRGTLPYERFASALSAEGIPHVYSDDAGGFVCNHVFYRACHEIASLGASTKCGFVHWPNHLDPASGIGQSAAVSFRALDLCLQVLSERVPTTFLADGA